MSKYNYFLNTGGLNLFSSVASLNQSENKTEWYDAQNVEPTKSGSIVKMKGNTKVNNTELSDSTKILGIFNYLKNGVSYPIINTSEGKIYRLDNNTGKLYEIFSGFDANAKCCFVNFNNGVFITNGVNIPVFYEYGSTDVADEMDKDTPKGYAVEVYRSRVFMAKGSCLHYSALGDCNDWSTLNDAGYIENFHNDSGEIIALKNYGEYLAIYKKNSVYILSGSSPEDFSILPVADKGATSAFCVGTVNNNQYFFNGQDITPLKFNDLGQVLLADDISVKIKPVFADLDYSRFSEVICVPYQAKNQIWFYFPEKNKEHLSICYIYDYYHKCWLKRKGTPIISANIVNGKIYTGTSDGRVLVEDYGNSLDGEDIQAYWYSPWFNFGKPDLPKEMLNAKLWLYQDQQFPINVIYSKDYGTMDHISSSMDVVCSTDMIWKMLNDVQQKDWDTFCWANTRPVQKTIIVKGLFNSLQIGIENSNADEPFSLIGFSFEIDFAS